MEKINVAVYSELPERAGQIVNINGEEIVLFRLTSGAVKAVENRSPHPKGGTLSDGLVSGEYVYCPVYDWKISLINGQVQLPDKGHVKTYLVEVEGDFVVINLNEAKNN